MKMNDSGEIPPDHNDDDSFEIVDLDAAQASDEGKKDAADRAMAKRTPARRPFLSQRRVQVAATTAILLAAIALWLSVSGAFSWLTAQVRPGASAPPAPARAAAVYTPPPNAQQDGLACLVDAAWSPDSKQVAVLGYGQSCQLMPGPPPTLQVNIYNGISQKLIRQVQLDGMILSPLRQRSAKSTLAASIDLGSIAWSPDGRQLAISFDTDEVGTVYDGVLLLAPNGQEQRVMLWPDNRQNSSSSYLLWNLVSGEARAIYYLKQTASPMQSPSIVNLQPAPAYRWGTNGALEPAPQPVGGAIGNPAGDPTFTIWQPGFAQIETQIPPLGPSLPVKFLTWSTQFAAWSSDGRYFIDQVNTMGRFVIPHQPIPDQQELVSLGMDQLATLTARDKALAGILATLLSGKADDAYIAWRPNGRELATYAAGRVEIYDCATGRKLASLISPNKPVNLNGDETFAWSPDGSRLMLSSSVWGVLTVWGPGQLPS
jgi:WD40 repeat protein